MPGMPGSPTSISMPGMLIYVEMCVLRVVLGVSFENFFISEIFGRRIKKQTKT
jgi:hypothetical protein